MPKVNPLTQGLKQQVRDTRVPVAPVNAPVLRVASAAKTVAPSRVGRVLLGGHFAPEVQTALKVLAAQERTSVQALLAEGIDAVFAGRQLPQIAALTPSERTMK